MKKTLSTVALTAAMLLGGAAAATATPTYSTPEECEAAGFIWAGDFCYTRQANNPEWLPTPTPEPTPEYSEAVPSPIETPAPTPVPIPEPVLTAEPIPAAPAAPVETPVSTPAWAPERTELAYTGAEDVILATAGVAIGLAGVGMVRWSLQRRREQEK